MPIVVKGEFIGPTKGQYQQQNVDRFVQGMQNLRQRQMQKRQQDFMEEQTRFGNAVDMAQNLLPQYGGNMRKLLEENRGIAQTIYDQVGEGKDVDEWVSNIDETMGQMMQNAQRAHFTGQGGYQLPPGEVGYQRPIGPQQPAGQQPAGQQASTQPTAQQPAFNTVGVAGQASDAQQRRPVSQNIMQAEQQQMKASAGSPPQEGPGYRGLLSEDIGQNFREQRSGKELNKVRFETDEEVQGEVPTFSIDTREDFNNLLKEAKSKNKDAGKYPDVENMADRIVLKMYPSGSKYVDENGILTDQGLEESGRVQKALRESNSQMFDENGNVVQVEESRVETGEVPSGVQIDVGEALDSFWKNRPKGAEQSFEKSPGERTSRDNRIVDKGLKETSKNLKRATYKLKDEAYTGSLTKEQMENLINRMQKPAERVGQLSDQQYRKVLEANNPVFASLVGGEEDEELQYKYDKLRADWEKFVKKYDLDVAKYELDKQYKEGLLQLQQAQSVIGEVVEQKLNTDQRMILRDANKLINETLGEGWNFEKVKKTYRDNEAFREAWDQKAHLMGKVAGFEYVPEEELTIKSGMLGFIGINPGGTVSMPRYKLEGREEESVMDYGYDEDDEPLANELERDYGVR